MVSDNLMPTELLALVNFIIYLELFMRYVAAV